MNELMLKELENIGGKTMLLISEDLDLCLLMKACFLSKNNRVYMSHPLSTALWNETENLPEIIMVMDTCDNKVTVVDRLLTRFPDVEMIFYLNTLVYER